MPSVDPYGGFSEDYSAYSAEKAAIDDVVSEYLRPLQNGLVDDVDEMCIRDRNYNIRMGIPEMQELWLELQEKYRSGNIKKKEEQLYKKWGKALKLLSADPGYPSLQTHEIEPLSRRYGMKVWQSYLENKTSGAMRMYWVYGPDQKDITIIGLEPHPEDKKNGAYDRISLSDL